MKPLLLLCLISSLLSFHSFDEVATRPEDRQAVERAIQDYVEGFYNAKPDLVQRGISKDMKKMGFARRSPADPYSKPIHMNFDQATELAKTWNAEDDRGDLKYQIEIYEVADKTACAKLTAVWGIDYFHLAKEEGAWKIHHVMWQTQPPTSGTADK